MLNKRKFPRLDEESELTYRVLEKNQYILRMARNCAFGQV